MRSSFFDFAHAPFGKPVPTFPEHALARATIIVTCIVTCVLKRAAVASIGAAIGIGSALAAEPATKDDAVAMVKKAVAFVAERGRDEAYAEISKKPGIFTDRDLYVVVYRLDGTVLAHGANAKLVGKDLSDVQDVDGKFFVKERVELARKQPTFWQDYKFVNPVSKKVEPKQMYCERLQDTAVCAGIYKF